MLFNNILVVCTGNICRSPMAAALLADRLANASEPPQLASAGTAALVNEPAAPEAVSLMAERGIDISGHRARQVSHENLRGTDLVLAADAGHVHWLKAQFPFMKCRVDLLGRWQGSVDVPDPYRHGMPTFERVLDTLDACIEDWVEKIHSGIEI